MEVVNQILQHRILYETAHILTYLLRVLSRLFFKVVCTLLNVRLVLVQITQLLVCLRKLLLFICQFEVKVAEFMLQVTESGRKLGTITFLISKLSMKFCNGLLFFRFFSFEISDHRSQTFHTSFCHCLFRLQVTENLLMLLNFFLKRKAPGI